MALGIRGVNSHRRDFVQRLDGLMMGTGEPLPAHTKQALDREHERLILAERQIKDIERAQASAIKAVARRVTITSAPKPTCALRTRSRHWSSHSTASSPRTGCAGCPG
jgi:hypothetical protein